MIPPPAAPGGFRLAGQRSAFAGGLDGPRLPGAAVREASAAAAKPRGGSTREFGEVDAAGTRTPGQENEGDDRDQARPGPICRQRDPGVGRPRVRPAGSRTVSPAERGRTRSPRNRVSNKPPSAPTQSHGTRLAVPAAMPASQPPWQPSATRAGVRRFPGGEQRQQPVDRAVLRSIGMGARGAEGAQRHAGDQPDPPGQPDHRERGVSRWSSAAGTADQDRVEPTDQGPGPTPASPARRSPPVARRARCRAGTAGVTRDGPDAGRHGAQDGRRRWAFAG